ncbi:MAG: ATP-NAD kinase family protein [Dethiobacteria bacterium]|nr:ATP-NAD kinase family protein [Dethiobacteria bacterium]
MKKLGLIINPIAGMGGKVGLKGTDGAEMLEKARLLGASPEAGLKTAQALKQLAVLAAEIKLFTCPGEMGENIARSCGFIPQVIAMGSDQPSSELVHPYSSPPAADCSNDHTTGPADTERAVRAMVKEGVDLLLFAGGDGTARNIYNVIGSDSSLPVIGIPAGVKIHSAVYATSPRNAGELARLYLQEGSLPLRRAEVMDIDEAAFREGRLSASLYGYLTVPCAGELMQHLKIGGISTEASLLEAIAEQVVENMENDLVYIVGPGSTLAPIMQKLGLQNTLLGVDVVLNGELLAADANEQQILDLIKGEKAKIIVTVIGGQGYIFGRGNQQISAVVIRQVGRANIIVVATREKILSLEFGRLLVDTGDEEVNRMLSGYTRIVTGYKEELIYPVSS